MAPEKVCVQDVMNPKIVFIDGMATAQEAVEVMKKEQVNALIVQKRNSDDAWAIVSVKDIVRKLIAEGRKFQDMHVYEIMTKPVLAVPADMDVRYAAMLLDRMGVSRAPVEKSGELLGMITLSSIIFSQVD